MARQPVKTRLYRVSFWYIVDVEDPEHKDARDAVAKAWEFLKVKPAGFEVRPYKPKKEAPEPGQ